MMRRRRDDIDREWEREPPAKIFWYKGYRCVILRHPHFGNLNGYIRVPKNHPCFEKGYDECNIECHGGLTYAGYLNTEYTEGANDYYIGFDTAHFNDLIPLAPVASMLNGTYKNMYYVTKECESIVRQLIKLEKKEKQ